MSEDQQLIRKLIDDWMRATAAGDLAKLLNLMDEDVVFLLPGQPPMRGKDAFMGGFRAAAGRFRIESTSDIQEIEIFGSWAYCWNHLSVTVTPIDGGLPMRKTGYTLTLFRKLPQGNWVVARDANLLGGTTQTPGGFRA